MKYYLIAGEASGDLHASHLMQAIKLKDPKAEFRFWGGDEMAKVGGTSFGHYSDLAVMGIDSLFKLPTIFKLLKAIKKDIQEFKPHVFIPVDYPAFNMRLLSFAYKQNISICYYIAPKVWAWNERRVKTLKRYVNHLLCILPFEKYYFKRAEIKATYVGNPTAEQVLEFRNEKTSQASHIALLPGSRVGEIKRILPVMVASAKLLKHEKFQLACMGHLDSDLYEIAKDVKNIELVFDDTYEILINSKAALVTSGTATLEAALFQVPQVVLYKAAPLTVAIARLLIRVRYISLVNLILDKEAVPELIQGDCVPEEVSKLLNALVSDGSNTRIQMGKDYKSLIKLLSVGSAAENAAEIVVQHAQM